jgi:hypothetical protein
MTAVSLESPDITALRRETILRGMARKAPTLGVRVFAGRMLAFYDQAIEAGREPASAMDWAREQMRPYAEKLS